MYIEHFGSVSSGDIQMTTKENTIIDFNVRTINSLTFYAISRDIHIKLNDSNTVHLIPSGTGKEFSKMAIKKITIIENNVDYYYDGQYY